MDRTELIDQARKGFRKAGRGMVVFLRGDTQARYVPANDAAERLADAKVEPDLLASVFYATGKYDPKWEAVLFLEENEGFNVYIVRTSGSEAIGETCWPSVN